MKKKPAPLPSTPDDDKKFPLPIYKKEDDIYSRAKEESLEEDDHPLQSKLSTEPGAELDVPGAELDDAGEAIGEEDEENNYYSLGGDNHDDLEEDND